MIIRHNVRSEYFDSGTLGSSQYTKHLAKLFMGNTAKTNSFNGGVRMDFGESPYGRILVLEEAPRLRRINITHRSEPEYAEDEEGNEYTPDSEVYENTYNVWTPWVVYFVTLNDHSVGLTHLYFSKESIKNTEHRLYMPSLPNIYNHDITPGTICNGPVDNRVVIKDGRLHVEGTLSNALSNFWNSRFNEDIVAFENVTPISILNRIDRTDFSEWSEEFPAYHAGMMNWQDLSAEEFMTVPFHYLFTLSEAIAKIGNRNGRELVEEVTESSSPLYATLYKNMGL